MLKKSNQYILRFDDICPTMNWQVWNQIESLLDKHQIKPLLAVIPDCKDEAIKFGSCSSEDFWVRVNQWAQKGYDIAIHGYSHVYINKKAGIVGVTRQSEFVGLSEGEQEKKLSEGFRIFNERGVNTDTWIAPSHSFDFTTLKVLKKYGVTYISDGFGTSLFKYKGMIWVPCQIWNRIVPMKMSGVYTICYHHSMWTKADLENFERDIVEYKEQISSFKMIVNNSSIVNGRPFSHIMEVTKRKFKNFIKNILLR